jgi:N-methylhydantoinase A
VAKPELPFSSNGGDSPIKGRREVSFFLSDDVEIPVLERDRLGVGYSMPGPVIVEEPQTTTVVLEGQRLEVTGNGDLLVKR